MDRLTTSRPHRTSPLNSEGRLPDGVRRFVEQRIDSVAELEGLLLVHSARENRWGARELASRLYVGKAAAGAVLLALHRQGLMSRHGETFWYGPASEALCADVEALAVAYPRFLITITEIIHEKHEPRE